MRHFETGHAENVHSLDRQRRGAKWARAALDAECAIVARMANGNRNNALNAAALKLGRKVAGGYLDAQEVQAALLAAAETCGYIAGHSLEAALATIGSGLAAGMAEPEHPQDRPEHQRPELPKKAPGEAPEAEPDDPGPHPEDPGPAPDDPPESGFFSAASLDGLPLPAQQWHVDGLIPARTVTMLGGDGGTGKSLLALMLMCSTALGRPWLGRAVTQGRALYLTAEDDKAELHRRLAAIAAAEGATLADLERLTCLSLAGQDALLAYPDPKTGVLMPTPRFSELDERIGDEKPDLVGLDTLADLHSANENDRSAARQFIGLLRGLAIRHDCTVLLLAHPSLTGMSSGSGLSGSTAWNASVRSRLYLERIIQGGSEPDPDKRILATKKAKHARVGAEIGMTWREGVFVAEAEPQGLDALAVGAKAERVFLHLLRKMAEQGRKVNAASGGNYAPSVFASHDEREGCTKQAMRSAMERLLSSGKVKVVQGGSPSRQVSWLEVA